MKLVRTVPLSALPFSDPQTGTELILNIGAAVLHSRAQDAKPPCAVCGTPYEKHGTAPTCASHDYTDGGHITLVVSASGVKPTRGAQPLPIKELLAIYDEQRGDWCAIVREVERRHGIGADGEQWTGWDALKEAAEDLGATLKGHAGVKVAPQLDAATVKAGEPEDVRAWLDSRRRCENPRCESWGCAKHDAGVKASEVERLRAEQAAGVMPQIGPLLDAWDGMDNDTKAVLREEAPDLARALIAIGRAMDGAPGVAPTGEARPLWDANNPRDGYVTDAEWAARRAAKPDTSDERLRAVLDVVMRWLTPDGIDSGAAMVEISGLVDPMPDGVKEIPDGR